MLRWVILTVAVVGLTAAATLVGQFLPDAEETKVPAVVTTGPQPKILLEGEPIYDFGKMPRFDKNSHSWVVKNVGEAPLEIALHGQTTCSCTVAKPGEKEKLVIPPGETNTIDLNWHTDKDLGKDYSQGATFATNDPHRHTFSLTVKGKVYPAVVVFPEQMIQFTRISNEESHPRRIAVYSQERPDVKLTKLTTSRPALIVAEAKPMTPAEAQPLGVEKGYMVTVEVKPGMPLGQFHDELIIQTDHPKQPEVKVSVGGWVFGPISVVPERLQIRNVSSRDGASQDVVLVVRGDKGTKFEVVRKPDKVDVAIAREDTATIKGRYRMTVSVLPGTPPGEVNGEIVLKTDHPMASEVKIPVLVLISRSGGG